MNEFRTALNLKLLQSDINDYGIENFDQDRFGEYPILNVPYTQESIILKIKKGIIFILGYHKRQLSHKYFVFYKTYEIGRAHV